MNSINLRNYGNLENLKQDSITLREIIDNQGVNFIVDVLADKIAESFQGKNLPSGNVSAIIQDVCDDLYQQLKERT